MVTYLEVFVRTTVPESCPSTAEPLRGFEPRAGCGVCKAPPRRTRRRHEASFETWCVLRHSPIAAQPSPPKTPPRCSKRPKSRRPRLAPASEYTTAASTTVAKQIINETLPLTPTARVRNETHLEWIQPDVRFERILHIQVTRHFLRIYWTNSLLLSCQNWQNEAFIRTGYTVHMYSNKSKNNTKNVLCLQHFHRQ